MSTAIAVPTVENLVLNLTQEIKVNASLETTFEALLDELGPAGENPDGKAMPRTLEAWPGGRWFRDLGDGNGHWWGTVQAIKRPTLLEIHGPLFMSFAVVNNVQYRLSKVEGGTLIAFHHYAVGAIPDDYRANIGKGWSYMFDRIRARLEKGK